MHTRMADWLTDPEAQRLPIYASAFAKKASGSSKADEEEDDDEDDDDDSDDDDDEDDDDDPDADKSDEELRAELKATRERLAKANGSSAKRRRALREKEAELDAERAKRAKAASKKDDDEDDKPDLGAVRDEARREGEKAGIARAKKSEARAALTAAGVNPARLQRAVGLIDLDELDLDDDGLDGIDDAIEDLRKEWPEMFSRGRRTRSSVAGHGDRDGDKPASKKNLTASERQAALLTGRS